MELTPFESSLLQGKARGERDAACFREFARTSSADRTKHRIYNLSDVDQREAHEAFRQALGLPEPVLDPEAQGAAEPVQAGCFPTTVSLERQIIPTPVGEAIGYVVCYCASIKKPSEV